MATKKKQKTAIIHDGYVPAEVQLYVDVDSQVVVELCDEDGNLISRIIRDRDAIASFETDPEWNVEVRTGD